MSFLAVKYGIFLRKNYVLDGDQQSYYDFAFVFSNSMFFLAIFK